MKIRTIASAIPTNVVESKEVAKWIGCDVNFIRKRLGVSKRAFLAPDEPGVSLAITAVDKLLSDSGISAHSVEFIIYITQTPDHSIPQNSAILHANIGFPTSVASFDIGLGCSGYPYALAVAKGFMTTQHFKRAIVVTCDPYSKILSRSDRATAALFGDAATATLIDEEGSGEIGLGDFGTDGKYWKSLVIPSGRGTHPIVSIHNEEIKIVDDPNAYRLHMKGWDLYNFVLLNVPKSIERTLSINKLSFHKVDSFALHQGSLCLLKSLASKLRIPEKKLLINIDKYGNTGPSTIPLLLEEYLENLETTDSRVLISGFGVGLSWSSLLLHFKKPYERNFL